MYSFFFIIPNDVFFSHRLKQRISGTGVHGLNCTSVVRNILIAAKKLKKKRPPKTFSWYILQVPFPCSINSFKYSSQPN